MPRVESNNWFHRNRVLAKTFGKRDIEKSNHFLKSQSPATSHWSRDPHREIADEQGSCSKSGSMMQLLQFH